MYMNMKNIHFSLLFLQNGTVILKKRDKLSYIKLKNHVYEPIANKTTLVTAKNTEQIVIIQPLESYPFLIKVRTV